jgi:hypothetical protein
MAIRRPNKPAEEFEPEELFAMDTMDQKPGYTSGFPVDMAIEKATTSAITHVLGARLMQGKSLFTSDSSVEGDASAFTFDFMDGWRDGNGDFFYQSWMWRRAPGFFDVVAYTGNNDTTRALRMNLGAPLELGIVKGRNTDSPNAWFVWHKDPALQGPIKNGYLYRDDPFISTSPAPIYGHASDLYFNVGQAANTAGVDYITFLFASVPGICSIGSYTGNGGVNKIIDCGFTNGARFVLIKRTDASGDWLVFDTLRGISVNDSPYLTLNETGKQVTGSRIVPDPAGFKIVTTEPFINADQGAYIYMAIA